MKKIGYLIAVLVLAASAARAETNESLREKAADMRLSDAGGKIIAAVPEEYPYSRTARRVALAKDIMSPLPVCVNASDTVSEALNKYNSQEFKNDVYVVLILDGMRPLGFTDIWKLSIADPDLKIGDAMERGKLYYSETVSAYQNTPVKALLKDVLKTGIALITLDNGIPVGVVTTKDIHKLMGNDALHL